LKKKFLIDGEEFIVGKIYDFEEEGELVFKGLYSPMSIEPGLYYDEDGGELAIIDASIPCDHILENSPDNKKDPVLVNTSSVNDIKSKKNGRTTANEILKYDINDNDDDMVRLVKQLINERELLVSEVIEKVKYNLVYGLRKRNSINYSSFLIWADFLRLKAEVTLKPLNKI